MHNAAESDLLDYKNWARLVGARRGLFGRTEACSARDGICTYPEYACRHGGGCSGETVSSRVAFEDYSW